MVSLSNRPTVPNSELHNSEGTISPRELFSSLELGCCAFSLTVINSLLLLARDCAAVDGWDEEEQLALFSSALSAVTTVTGGQLGEV